MKTEQEIQDMENTLAEMFKENDLQRTEILTLTETAEHYRKVAEEWKNLANDWKRIAEKQKG